MRRMRSNVVTETILQDVAAEGEIGMTSWAGAPWGK
jgi:hypothetical protein